MRCRACKGSSPAVLRAAHAACAPARQPALPPDSSRHVPPLHSRAREQRRSSRTGTTQLKLMSLPRRRLREVRQGGGRGGESILPEFLCRPPSGSPLPMRTRSIRASQAWVGDRVAEKYPLDCPWLEDEPAALVCAELSSQRQPATPRATVPDLPSGACARASLRAIYRACCERGAGRTQAGNLLFPPDSGGRLTLGCSRPVRSASAGVPPQVRPRPAHRAGERARRTHGARSLRPPARLLMLVVFPTDNVLRLPA